MMARRPKLVCDVCGAVVLWNGSAAARNYPPTSIPHADAIRDVAAWYGDDPEDMPPKIAAAVKCTGTLRLQAPPTTTVAEAVKALEASGPGVVHDPLRLPLRARIAAGTAGAWGPLDIQEVRVILRECADALEAAEAKESKR